jgi:hypothetical protein
VCRVGTVSGAVLCEHVQTAVECLLPQKNVIAPYMYVIVLRE